MQIYNICYMTVTWNYVGKDFWNRFQLDSEGAIIARLYMPTFYRASQVG